MIKENEEEEEEEEEEEKEEEKSRPGLLTLGSFQIRLFPEVHQVPAISIRSDSKGKEEQNPIIN